MTTVTQDALQLQPHTSPDTTQTTDYKTNPWPCRTGFFIFHLCYPGVAVFCSLTPRLDRRKPKLTPNDHVTRLDCKTQIDDFN